MKEDLSTVEMDFISIRHKLLDVAAFLDRVERAKEDSDFRVKALQEALPLLESSDSQRTKRILEHFSDFSESPIEQAPGKGACGTVPPGESA